MNQKETASNDNIVFFIFLLVPTIMLIVGYFLFPCSSSPDEHPLVYIPLFLGLVFLGFGFLLKDKKLGSKLKISGWMLFSFFWALLPRFLYDSEGGDIFNAVVCIIGVYILIYMAYHEWLSIQRKNHPLCLNWIAGGTFFAGIIYFTIDSSIFPELKTGLIELVAAQSAGVLQLFGLEAYREGSLIVYNGVPITIIFACTAVQSMVLFVGMIGALQGISMKRRLTALAATVIPIYFLNLIRNAGVVYMVGADITSFEMAHNVIAKVGSLIALIALLFVTFKIVPELYDEILCIFDLPKRKGPVENFFAKLLGKTKK
jgi:archaeosortase A (PGF-CTERM-specific)